jgi:5-formyltetrahydrofolate cyclo-ligase
MNKEKQRIRAIMAKRLDAFTSADVAAASRAVCAKLGADKDIRNATSLVGYMAFDKEINLYDFLAQAIKEGKKVYLPKYDKKTEHYILARVNCLKTGVAKGKYGILEPVSLELPDENIDCWLIPGLAFDKTKNRLGRGAGYYDHLLAFFAGRKIGIAYQCQIVEKLAVEPWDIAMDKLVTDSN